MTDAILDLERLQNARPEIGGDRDVPVLKNVCHNPIGPPPRSAVPVVLPRTRRYQYAMDCDSQVPAHGHLK